VKRFRGGLVSKAHRLVYHSTLGLRVIKKKKYCRERRVGRRPRAPALWRDAHAAVPVSLYRARERVPVGWCHQTWGDNISVLPDFISLPADNTELPQSPG